MPRITERQIISLFADIERDLNEALDQRFHAHLRLGEAKLAGEPYDIYENDLDALTEEISDLRAQRKNVINLAIGNGMDPGRLLDTASEQQRKHPEKFNVRDIKEAIRALADWQDSQALHVQVRGDKGREVREVQ